MNKNERFLVNQLNTALKKRTNHSFIFDLIDKVYKVQINKMPRIQEWIKTASVNLIEIDITSNNTYQRISLGLN